MSHRVAFVTVCHHAVHVQHSKIGNMLITAGATSEHSTPLLEAARGESSLTDQLTELEVTAGCVE